MGLEFNDKMTKDWYFSPSASTSLIAILGSKIEDTTYSLQRVCIAHIGHGASPCLSSGMPSLVPSPSPRVIFSRNSWSCEEREIMKGSNVVSRSILINLIERGGRVELSEERECGFTNLFDHFPKQGRVWRFGRG